MKSSRRVTWLLLAALCTTAYSQSKSGNLTSLADVWPAMINVSTDVSSGKRPTWLGGLSMGKCCQLKLNESVEIVNGSLAFVPGQTFLHGNLSVFAAQHNDPCSTSYTGYEASVPQGTMSSAWCLSHCGGWELNSPTNYGNWAFPMMNYIVPAIVFALNVPRRRVLHLSGAFFPGFTFPGALAILYTLPAAVVCATLEVLVWMITIVTYAGPMMASGLMESMFDRRILLFLRSRSAATSLTRQQKGRLALLTLLGHLDIEPAWEETNLMIDLLPDNSQSHSTMMVWNREVNFLFKSLLSSQAEFGVALGVGLVFFLATFIYSDVEIQQNGGNSVTAHALSLGIFWMVIPHTAIIATSLLSGSNSSAWAAVVKSLSAHAGLSRRPSSSTSVSSGTTAVRSSTSSPPPGRTSRLWDRAGIGGALSKTRQVVLENFEEEPRGLNKQKSMWDRGPSKGAWLRTFQQEYPGLNSTIGNIADITIWDWIFKILLPVNLLLIAPSFLGSMIGYTTPVVGLSCKSGSPVLYCIAQFALTCHWAIKHRVPGRTRSPRHERYIEVLCLILKGFWLTIAFAASILLTALAYVGVMNNCLCYIPIQNWLGAWTDNDPYLPLGSDTDHSNDLARRFWLPAGGGAVAFLLSMCMWGWLHQKKLRQLFVNVVDELTGVTMTHGVVQMVQVLPKPTVPALGIQLAPIPPPTQQPPPVPASVTSTTSPVQSAQVPQSQTTTATASPPSSSPQQVQQQQGSQIQHNTGPGPAQVPTAPPVSTTPRATTSPPTSTSTPVP